MYYNTYIMTTNDEPRRVTTIRLRPGAQRRAKVAAARARVTIGEWIEEAIQEKAAREGNND